MENHAHNHHYNPLMCPDGEEHSGVVLVNLWVVGKHFMYVPALCCGGKELKIILGAIPPVGF